MWRIKEFDFDAIDLQGKTKRLLINNIFKTHLCVIGVGGELGRVKESNKGNKYYTKVNLSNQDTI